MPEEVDFHGQKWKIFDREETIAIEKVAKEKLEKALVIASLEKPFWGWASVMYSMELVPTFFMKDGSHLPTMCTDGKHIFYNPGFVAELPPYQVLVSLIHETFHAVDNHLERGQVPGREHRKFNFAGDYCINLTLARAGFKIPKWMLMNPEFVEKLPNATGTTVLAPEQIYKLIPDPPKEESQDPCDGTDGKGGDCIHKKIMQGKAATKMDDKGPGAGDCGLLPPDPKETPDEREGRIRQALEGARQLCQQQGLNPSDFEERLKQFTKLDFDYRGFLEPWLREVTQSDWTTWTRPDRNLLAATGSIFPGVQSDPTGCIVCVIDTSGSVPTEDLESFCGFLSGALQTLGTLKKLVLVWCDAAVQGDPVILTPEDLPLDPSDRRLGARGRGGTDFRPPFEWVERQWPDVSEGDQISGLVYLTDMFGTFPPEAPEYPVLWVATSDQVAPFGITTRLKKAKVE